MEKAIPFPTGFSFRSSHCKHLTLNYEVSIEIDTQDCRNFNLFFLTFSSLSTIYTILEFALDSLTLQRILANSAGLIIWIYCIIIYIKCSLGYSSLKSSKIKFNSILLLIYLILQFSHIAFTVTSLYVLEIETKRELFSNLEVNSMALTIFLGLCLALAGFSYAFFLNLSLADKVKKISSLN